MNVKRVFSLALLGVLAGVNVACGGGEATPTRTPRAVAENIPTQTPWIIYVPVTTTPEPFTVTPLPTVTSAQPTPKPTNTRTPRPAATKAPPSATPVPATIGPSATPVPSCGQVYRVNATGQTVFPKDGDTRDTCANCFGKAIQFRFPPVVTWDLDPTIGYRVAISRANGPVVAERFRSHNFYLTVQNGDGIVLNGRDLWEVSRQGESNLSWTVSVVKAAGGFDDNQETAIGAVQPCGDPTGPFRVFVQAL